MTPTFYEHHETPVTEQLLMPYQAVRDIPARRVLVLAPHPDDEVFGCGGAILAHVAAGVPLRVIVMTDGAWRPGADTSRSDYVATRQAECRAAARLLGYADIDFRHHGDRTLAYGERLVAEIQADLAASGADLVYAPSVLEMHPDHRALGMAAAEAVRRHGQGLRLAFYEIGVPLQPNLLLDISAFAERKQAAMACFASQNSRQRYDQHIAALNRYRTYTLGPEVTAAEAYLLTSAAELARDPFKLYQTEHARQRALGLAVDSQDVPLVSIIVRSMDRPTLDEALDSVSLQAYANIEVVLVNARGGQHRDLGQWCGRFPLRLVNQGAQALGRAAAANAGLDACRGRYIGFLDDDDTLDADHISQLVAALQQEAGPVVAYAGVRVMRRNDPEHHSVRVFAEPFDDKIKLLAGNFIPFHAPLFPRWLIDAGVRLDENLALYEDCDFWLQLAQQARFVFVDKISATYFAGGTSGVSAFEPDADLVNRAQTAIYDKWRLHITGDMLRHLSGYWHRYHELSPKYAALEIQHETMVSERDALVTERDGQIANLNQAVAERDGQIISLNQGVAEQERRLNQVVAERDAAVSLATSIRCSTSWRITAPLRFGGHILRGDVTTLRNIVSYVRRRMFAFIPERFRFFLQRQLDRLLSLTGSTANSTANGEAIAAIISERCAVTQETPAIDPLTAYLISEPPCVDISVVTYNSDRWVNVFIEGLRAIDYPKSHIIVRFVDNSSTDNTVETLQMAAKRLREEGFTVDILQRPNRGFGAGHNVAIKAGNAPFCLITNIDLTFERDTLTRLIAAALADVAIAAAWEARQKPYEHPKFYDPVTGTTNWNSHACVLLRRSALEYIGGYDETLFMYGEDVELSYRLRRAGFVLRYCPSAVVLHYSYEETDRVKPLQYNGSTFANLYLRLKYGNLVDMLAVPPMSIRLVMSKEVYPGSRRAVLRNLARLVLVTPKVLLLRRRSKAYFPFKTWDYEMIRDSAFVHVPPIRGDTPLVSVITRTYSGREVFLRQALLSVAHQSYPSIEHIVVEDGGDTMRGVVDGISRITGRYIRFIELNKVGRSAAGNAGLEASSGRWCVFLDDDDLMFGDHIEVLVNALHNEPDAVAAYSLAWEVLTTTPTLPSEGYRELTHSVPALMRQEFDHEVLSHHNFMPIQQVLFERRLFIERGGFENDMDALEDWILWNRYAYGNRFIYVPKVTSLFRTPSDPAKIRQRQDVMNAAYPSALARVKAIYQYTVCE